MRPRPGSLSARLLSRSLQGRAAFVGALMLAAPAFANHPVLVEGNCNVPPAGGPQGACRADYDGDGSTGTVEDGDGDRVFGTLGAALAAAGANQNGRVVIVSSGTFAESVRISGANGNVTLEAAPGVEANVDAVLQGDPGSIARQSAPGIVVDAPGTRIVTLRNLVSRNWTEGILVRGASRVVIDGCRLESNTNYGIHVVDQARATITGTTVSATGFRVGAAAPGQTNDFPVLNLPDPGVGIEFEGEASGVVAFSTVSSSFGTGILNDARHGRDVRACQVTAFDNARNYDRVAGGGCRGDDD